MLLGAGDLMGGLPDEQERAIQAFRSSLDRNPTQEKALKALRTLAARKDPPAEALDTWRRTGMDLLVLGGYLVKKACR